MFSYIMGFGFGDVAVLNALEKLKRYASDPAVWGNVLYVVLKILLIIIAGRVVMKIANKALTHMVAERERTPLKFDQRRTKTIGKLLHNIVTYTVNFIVILLVLNQLGINLGPLLAGAGVLGLAIGFGAQSLVKDVITGFFIIFEDQFGVGDVIQTGSFKGTVEEIGLRVTRLRTWNGELHIIPNGSIQQVTNFSVYNSVAVVDVSIAYEEDIEKALDVLRQAVGDYYGRNPHIVKPPEVLGVQTMGNHDVVIRITAECMPNTHPAVERELKKTLKQALDQNGIEIPYPKMVSLVRSEKAE